MGQVQATKLKKTIKNDADFWYTAWINAGQPEFFPILAGRKLSRKRN